MKKIYWTAYNIHPFLMILLSIVSILCLYVVEHNKELVKVKDFSVKIEAAEMANKAFKAIYKYRLNKGYSIDRKYDKSGTGLVGKKNTIITSDKGVLRSKQIAANPNLAALVVDWLLDLKLQEGDTVAIGMTGSFPGVDISTLAAVNALKLKPLLIVSASASQWGANIPGLSILDMLAVLKTQKILTYPVLAASVGGGKDLGTSLDPKGAATLRETIQKYQIPLIGEPKVSLSIDKRLNLYKQAAKGEKIKAYINIGGGVASIGKHFSQTNLSNEQKVEILKHSLKTGPNTELPVQLAHTNSVSVRYLKQGIPVINAKDISVVAARYSLKPWLENGPIGTGKLFYTQQYKIWLAIISLAIILAICWVLVRVQLAQKKAQDVLIDQDSQGPVL